MDKTHGNSFERIQGPNITLSHMKRCKTEAARAFAHNRQWLFNFYDAVFNTNKEKLCDTIEQLADILVDLRIIQELNGGCFVAWTEAESIDVENEIRERASS